MVTAGLGGGWAMGKLLVMPEDKSYRISEEFLFACLLIAACTVWACVCVHAPSMYELHHVEIVRGGFLFFRLERDNSSF